MPCVLILSWIQTPFLFPFIPNHGFNPRDPFFSLLQAGKPLVLNVVKKAEATLLQDPTLNKVCLCVSVFVRVFSFLVGKGMSGMIVGDSVGLWTE